MKGSLPSIENLINDIFSPVGGAMRPLPGCGVAPVGYEIEFHVEFFRQNLGIAVRLLTGQGRADDAWQVLHGIHAGFEEGFDTPISSN